MDNPQDSERLQLVLVLMSVYHQSVYNNITEHAQRTALGIPPSESVSGYYLCHGSYAQSVFALLTDIIRRKDTRFITVQCCVYILKYLLSNHIYGDTLPFSVFYDLAEV